MSKSVKFVKIVSPLALAIALAACGGGGSGANFGSNTGGSTPTGGTGTTSTIASSIELSVSSRQLPSDGSAPITITAIAKDANNNAIEGADIIFSVDKDATIIKNATVTTTVDPNNPTATPVTTVVTAGSIQTATLTPGSKTNQTLNVTAISGNSSKSITVDVVGTELTIDGPQAITLKQASSFLLKLKDSSNKAIAFENVVISSEKGNTITTESNFQTNDAGEIAFKVNGDSSGTDTISGNVLGASFNKIINVSGDEFALSSVSSKEININTNASIDFIWTKNGVVQSGKTITLSATRGDITSQTAVTDANGKASFSISSSTAGRTVITATTVDGLSTTLEREFVATTPAYLNTQADPTLISPNGTSTIFAKIRDKNDNPVKNKIIDFRLSDTVDGVLSGSTAVTDSLGRASISYKAGNSSSAKDGVKIKTFIQGYPTVAEDEIKLTVGGDALRIVLGDDHLLVADNVFYIKKFGVIVTDSAGNPIKGQNVSFKIVPTKYYKGRLWYTGDIWTQQPDGLGRGITATCPSEDFDNDGNLDIGEDINKNGSLEPTHDATVTGSGVTDDKGKIVVEVVFPKNTAWWSDQRIEATVAVEGTEYLESTEFNLPVVAADVKGEGTPPNRDSPYGTWGDCTNNPDDPAPIPPSVVTVVNPLVGAKILKANTLYSIAVDGVVLPKEKYMLTPSSHVSVNYGNNNTFTLVDNAPTIDDSGFNIKLKVNGQDSIELYYQDDGVVAPPPVDTNGPIVTLNGSANITLTLGDQYIEQSANAVDVKDGVVIPVKLGSVPVNASNLTTTAGSYTIIYRATDSDGNVSTVTRLVNVNN